MPGQINATIVTTRATIKDVALQAGVSPATADRVLNARSGVSQRTRDVVLDAAQRLGYIAAPPSAASTSVAISVATGKIHDVVFLLPEGTNAFIQTLGKQLILQGKERPDLRVRVEMIESFSPQTVAHHLDRLTGVAAGVGIIAQDHPLVREAIRNLVKGGTDVVTLASDIQSVPRLAYVGIDNRQAGRLAGHLMGRLLAAAPTAKIALFSGSLSYRGHEEREMGFRNILREEFPTLQVVETCEILDDRERAEIAAAAVLARHPDLKGIYNVGGGSYGIAQALRVRGPQHPVMFIAHEATDGNKRLLLEGLVEAVIDQNPRVEAREALNILAAAANRVPYVHVPPRTQVIFKENLPEE